jgi:SAM-dependent methyltransferase
MEDGPMNPRHAFYRKVVAELISDKDASILICGAGPLDKETFESLGFKDVTISNLDSRMTGTEYAPFKWAYQNAESLSYPDKSFDYTVIHAAVHHASSPHRVVTEMYRVAKKGLLAFESRDSVIMRFLERNGLNQVYEHAAVYYNDCDFGGMNNTDIPNYVYRWTEREVEKTIQSYAPYYPHKYEFRYGTAFPVGPELENKGKLKVILLKVASPFYSLFTKVFPRQQNLFAFYVGKPDAARDAAFPWLDSHEEGGETRFKFNKVWGDQRYKSAPPAK